MKYFFLLFWTCLLREILSVPQDKQEYFLQNVGKIYKKQTLLNDNLEENSFFYEYTTYKDDIMKRDVETDKISGLSNKAKELQGNQFISNNEGKIYFYPITTERLICPTPKFKNSPKYKSVQCDFVPGKIICQSGKYVFVINNGDHNMDREVIERFIVMAFHRYGEGDDNFDVAVNDVEKTNCLCNPTPTIKSIAEVTTTEESLVTIECDLVSNDKLKMCNPNYNPTEKIYQCKAKVMGLKKRSVLNISVDKYGKVSLVKDFTPLNPKTRIKRDMKWPQTEEAMFINENLLKHKANVNNDYYGQENIRDVRFDREKLLLKTNAPYIRNYTDTCTLNYQFFPWCPHYISENPCGITKYTTTARVCREVENRAPQNKGEKGENGRVEETTTICTVEVTTEEVAFKPKSAQIKHMKRNKTYWRRRRRFQMPSKYDYYYNRRRNSDVNRKGIQSLADTAEGSTPCPPCNPTTTEGGCSTTNATTACSISTNASTEWCTITVPCNTSTTECSTSKTDKKKKVAKMIEKSVPQKGLSYKNPLITAESSADIVHSVNKLSVPKKLNNEILRYHQFDQTAENKPFRAHSYNMLKEPYSLMKDEERNNHNFKDIPRGYSRERTFRSLRRLPENFIYEMNNQFRPKRKILIGKVPRLRRRHINRWQKKRAQDFGIY